MHNSNQNFISIPDNSFTIFIGSRLFLTESLKDIPGRFSHRKILYIHSGLGLPYIELKEEERKLIEFRPVQNPVDVLVMVESDPARFMIIEYNPEWFLKSPEYILPFGHLCRERSIQRREVLLISRIFDNVIEELEPIAHKMAFVQDILVAPNKNTCDMSQITFENSHPIGDLARVPALKYGQQDLGF